MSTSNIRLGPAWMATIFKTVAVLAAFGAGCGSSDRSTGRAEPNEGDSEIGANVEPGTRHMEVATIGVEVSTGSPVVLLRDPHSARTLSVWVGPAEARAILLAMQGIEMPRPMTHDLLVSVLRELDAELLQVRIDDLRDGTYFGKLILRVGDAEEPRIIDTRPSDGLALAVRTGAPIQVLDHLLETSPDIEFTPLQEGEQVVSAVGITVVRPTDERRESFQLPDHPGVFVLHAAGAAQDLGLTRGDLIITVNDNTLETPMEFFEALQATRPGEMLRIRYFRGQKEHELELPVEQPPRPEMPRHRIA